MIIGLFPDLLPPGGVQTAGRQTAAALQQFAVGGNTSFRFLSLHDPAGKQQFQSGNSFVEFEGFAGRRAKFIAKALRAAGGNANFVWAAHPNLAPIAAAMKLTHPSMRVVLCAHGVEVWTPLPLLRRLAVRRADLVVAPSSFTIQTLTSTQGIAPERVRRLPWALDPEFEKIAASPAPDAPPFDFPSGKIILTVGRWSANERYKGLDELIEVMPAVRAEIPDAVLVAVGNGDDRARLQAKAAPLINSGAALFLDSLRGPSLASAYRHCDVFALPSSGEGFGLVFLEAMAFGKPLVGGAHGGIPDIIENGANGFLVSRDDRRQLTSVLIQLLRDASLRELMGERGRLRLQHAYTFAAFSSRLNSILSEIAA